MNPSEIDLRTVLLDEHFPWFEVYRGKGTYLARVSEAVQFVDARTPMSRESIEAELDALVHANGGRRMRTQVIPVSPKQVWRYLKEPESRGTDSYEMPSQFFVSAGRTPRSRPPLSRYETPGN